RQGIGCEQILIAWASNCASSTLIARGQVICGHFTRKRHAAISRKKTAGRSSALSPGRNRRSTRPPSKRSKSAAPMAATTVGFIIVASREVQKTLASAVVNGFPPRRKSSIHDLEHPDPKSRAEDDAVKALQIGSGRVGNGEGIVCGGE